MPTARKPLKEPLEKLLSGCSQTKLIELIGRMVEQQPDLESWLELALQSVNPTRGGVKPELYCRKTVKAFASADGEWDTEGEVADALQALRKFGEQFREQEDFESAAAVYCGILQGFLQSYESQDDESGSLSSIAGDCMAALGECLGKLAEDSEIRLPAVKVLFDILRFDISQGGLGLSDSIPEILVARALPAERVLIAGWIRDEIPAGGDFSSNWQRQSWGSLLLDLEGEPTDDEAYLRHCRQFGLTAAAVERLLERGRLDEALQDIRASSDYDLMGHADRLIVHQHADLAHTLVQDRCTSQPTSNNYRQLRDWLKRYYQTRQVWPALLKLCVEDFGQHPSLAGYQEIRKVSQQMKSWESLRPGLLSQLANDPGTLIRVHLDEGDVATAIALLDTGSTNRRGLGFGADRVDLEVAKAAEKSHPQTSIKIYRQQAEQLIAARSRSYYEAACEYLKKLKQLYQSVNSTEDWQTYITNLRTNHRALRALQDEMTKARL